MIVPMKKIYLLLLDSDKKEGLKALRELGIVHLENVTGESSILEDLLVKRDLVQRSIFILPEVKAVEKTRLESMDTVMEIAKRIVSQSEKEKALSDEISNIKKELERLEDWGDFNPEDINNLRGKGLDLRLFELIKDDMTTFPEGTMVFPVKSLKTKTFAAVVLPEDCDLPDLQEVPLPEMSISGYNKLLKKKTLEREKIILEISKLSDSMPSLKAALDDLDQEIEFETLRSGMEVNGPVAFLKGYLPVKSVESLKTAAKKHAWGLLVTEPEDGETVPTLIENPRAIRIIQPVFDLLGIIPGYHERDTSFFFLLFLTIFFAMIVGDGGYGLIFLSASLFFGLKTKKKTGKMPEMLVFLTVMSIFTIIWGALSGTWFGSKVLSNIPLLKMITVDKIASFSQNDTSELIKHICFILGTIQISIAHIWNFLLELKKKPVLKAFAQLGWLSMVNGLYYLVLNFVLDPDKYPVPMFALYMILGGLAAVVLFSQQEGNFFKGILKGVSALMTIALDSIGAFSDIISYIRLFAVGLATLAVASSFNSMASGMGHGVAGIVGSVLILILGHGLNLAMGALAIIVHGVRLNVLEFSGHLGMEWSGINYNPFRNKKKEK